MRCMVMQGACARSQILLLGFLLLIVFVVILVILFLVVVFVVFTLFLLLLLRHLHLRDGRIGVHAEVLGHHTKDLADEERWVRDVEATFNGRGLEEDVGCVLRVLVLLVC